MQNKIIPKGSHAVRHFQISDDDILPPRGIKTAFDSFNITIRNNVTQKKKNSRNWPLYSYKEIPHNVKAPFHFCETLEVRYPGERLITSDNGYATFKIGLGGVNGSNKLILPGSPFVSLSRMNRFIKDHISHFEPNKAIIQDLDMRLEILDDHKKWRRNVLIDDFHELWVYPNTSEYSKSNLRPSKKKNRHNNKKAKLKIYSNYSRGFSVAGNDYINCMAIEVRRQKGWLKGHDVSTFQDLLDNYKDLRPFDMVHCYPNIDIPALAKALEVNETTVRKWHKAYGNAYLLNKVSHKINNKKVLSKKSKQFNELFGDEQPHTLSEQWQEFAERFVNT